NSHWTSRNRQRSGKASRTICSMREPNERSKPPKRSWLNAFQRPPTEQKSPSISVSISAAISLNDVLALHLNSPTRFGHDATLGTFDPYVAGRNDHEATVLPLEASRARRHRNHPPVTALTRHVASGNLHQPSITAAGT